MMNIITFFYKWTLKHPFRVDGRVCCDGYTLNDVTKQCESKCLRYNFSLKVV